MTWILAACFVGLVVSWLGMVSCLPGIARQRRREREMHEEWDLQKRIDATAWTPYHPKKGKYRRSNAYDR